MRTLAKTLIIALALTVALAAQRINAAPIVGSIDFGGVVTFDTMSLATATTVNTWNSALVLQSSGDFSTVTPGTGATMGTPWIFNSGTPGSPMPGPPKPGLWAVGGFTFDLSSSVVVVQNVNFLNVTGPGTINGIGFDSTPGIWTFTSSNSNGDNSSTFSFQANTSAVPEAGTSCLLATGALVLGAARFLGKKRFKAPAL